MLVWTRDLKDMYDENGREFSGIVRQRHNLF